MGPMPVCDNRCMENSNTTQSANMSQPTVSVPAEAAVQPTKSKRGYQRIVLFVLGFGLVSVVGATCYYLGWQRGRESVAAVSVEEPLATPDEKSVACTMEAKFCPDGSSVGRVGPNCEFAECPVGASVDSSTTWEVYKSANYPYQISYPDGFTYSKLDAGKGQYEGYKENANFEKTGDIDTKIVNFYVYVMHPVSGSPYEGPADLIFDQKASGTIPMGEVEAYYGELPQGYGDGAMQSPPPPLLAIQFVRDGSYYKIVFEGISSISNPLATQILQSFKFVE